MTKSLSSDIQTSSPRQLRDARQLSLDEFTCPRPPQSQLSLSIDSEFPEEFVNDLSGREVFNKHLFRPNTYLHKWWARRCGTTFRAILKQFADRNESRDYYMPGGLEGTTVLDPMMGGGTTLHEAIRLGANVIGADIDPIPIVQARASLSQANFTDLRVAFDGFFADLQMSLRPYFLTECPACDESVDVQYVLHGRRRKCACREVLQIDQCELRQDDNGSYYICPESGKVYRESNGKSVGVESSPARVHGISAAGNIVTKAERDCSFCGRKFEDLLDLPLYARYSPVAIVGSCARHGAFFRAPSERDFALIGQADERRSGLDFGSVDDFVVQRGPKSNDLLNHNVRSYLDMFSSRQLLYLHEAIRLLGNYSGIERLILGLLVSTSLEFNAMFCGYKGWYKRRPGAIRHVFALHAYSFQYTLLENNPVYPKKSSGNLQLLFRDRIERGRKWSSMPIERKIRQDGRVDLVKIAGEFDSGVEAIDQDELMRERNRFLLIQGDSRHLPLDTSSVDLVVTDPPYYDSVQYSNLAIFFRVWLRLLLPEEAVWCYDESNSAVSTKANAASNNFMNVLAGIFAECARVLKERTGRMVFTFHHWDPDAWSELTMALKRAEFRLMNAYVVSSEHPISVHIRNLNSIRHDCVLVFGRDGKGPSVPWKLPIAVETSDSETFCRHCGAILGFLLESGPSMNEVRETWKDLIGASADG